MTLQVVLHLIYYKLRVEGRHAGVVAAQALLVAEDGTGAAGHVGGWRPTR